jgi:hypothetical protein
MADKSPAHEVQARQELANAEELGNEESARAARKRLEAAGADLENAAVARSKAADTKAADRAPQGRQAPSKQHG